MPITPKKVSMIKQMLDSAEKSISSARKLLIDIAGDDPTSTLTKDDFREKLDSLSVSEVDRIVEGVFDGENMIGADKRIYPIPANYASKSKLVEGDTLKLTIAEDGSFIYKQIGPVERKKVIGTLIKEDTGQFKVKTSKKVYKVLLASVTYFKAEQNDEITLVVPREGDVEWGAVENVIKKAGADDSKDSEDDSSLDQDDDEISDDGLADIGEGIQELKLEPKKAKKK